MIKINYIKTRAPFLIERYYFNINEIYSEDYWRNFNSGKYQFIFCYKFEGHVGIFSKTINGQQFKNSRFFYQDWLMDKHGGHLNG